MKGKLNLKSNRNRLNKLLGLSQDSLLHAKSLIRRQTNNPIVPQEKLFRANDAGYCDSLFAFANEFF